MEKAENKEMLDLRKKLKYIETKLKILERNWQEYIDDYVLWQKEGKHEYPSCKSCEIKGRADAIKDIKNEIMLKPSNTLWSGVGIVALLNKKITSLSDNKEASQ